MRFTQTVVAGAAAATALTVSTTCARVASEVCITDSACAQSSHTLTKPDIDRLMTELSNWGRWGKADQIQDGFILIDLALLVNKCHGLCGMTGPPLVALRDELSKDGQIAERLSP